MSSAIFANKTNTRAVSHLFYVLFLNSIIESFLLFFDDRFSIILAQLFLNGSYLLFVFLSLKKAKKPPHIRTITLLLVLLIVCSLFSSSLITSFNYLLKFIIPYLFYIVGYNLIDSKELFNYLISKVWIFLAYFAIYIIIVNAFGIGEAIYSGGLKVGYYSLNGLYIPTFSVLFLFFFYQKIVTRKERILGIVFAVITFSILVLLLKRTLILLVVLGFVLYLLKTISIKRIFQTIVVAGVFFVIGFFFQQQLSESFESRSSRFSNKYNIGEEGRFTEIIFLFDYMSRKPITLLIGTGEVFNDRETVSRIYGVDREAHNSFIRIFWNSGFVGLFLFVVLYFQQFNRTRLGYKHFKGKGNLELSHFLFFVIVFIFLRFINDFSSGITYLGYNAFSLIIIGGAFRIMDSSLVSERDYVNQQKKKLNNVNSHL